MSNLKGKAKKPGINKKVLILPGLIWISGAVLFARHALHKEFIRLDREMPYFDGKYNVNEVYEEIDAVRNFYQSDRSLLEVRDNVPPFFKATHR